MMDDTGDFDLEKWVQSVGINTSGSFSSPRQCERSYGTIVSLTGTNAIVRKFKKVTHPSKHNWISDGEHVENTDASSWNVSAVFCGDGSSGFQMAPIMVPDPATVVVQT